MKKNVLLNSAIILSLTIVLVFLMLVLVGCSSNESADPVTTKGLTTNTPMPQSDEDQEEEVLDADDWYYRMYWNIQAKVDQTINLDEFLGFPGAIAMYTIGIMMTSDQNYAENSSISGAYELSVNTNLKMDTDQAADYLAGEMLGGQVEGLGLGISVDLVGLYTDDLVAGDSGDPRDFIMPVKSDFRTEIKDAWGDKVTPAVGSYLYFKQIDMEYSGYSSHAIYGTHGDTTTQTMQLFILIPKEDTSVDFDMGDHPVKVYIHVLDFLDKGKDVWLEGSGTMKIMGDRLD